MTLQEAVVEDTLWHNCDLECITSDDKLWLYGNSSLVCKPESSNDQVNILTILAVLIGRES